MLQKAEIIERFPRSSGTLYGRRERQDWPPDRDFRILSIDGGGIRGILPLAILAELEKTHLSGRSIATQFDMLCGTSTGGIIALGLGKGLTANEILQIYLEQGGEVFPAYGAIAKKFRSALGYVFNRCDTGSLYNLIDQILGDTRYWESSCRICIPSAETKFFEPFVFKTPHHADYRLDYKQKMAFIAKTTSAAPGHFRPLRSKDGYEFVDGGIWANNPIMIGVADALACYDLQREQLKVLSLGCGAVRQEMTWLRRKLGGLATWATLILEAMEIQSHNVVGQARLTCGGDRVLRINPPLKEEIALWDWEKSRADLPSLGIEWADHLSALITEQFLYGDATRLSPIYQE